MHPFVLPSILGFTAGAANIAGGALLVVRPWGERSLKCFMALGAGFMLATSITEMVPASVALNSGTTRAGFLALLGYLLIHVCEHVVSGHFHFGEETHTAEFAGDHRGITVLVGLIVHAFFDGIAIASGFQVSNWLGWIIFLAIFLHKIPEGFTITSVMLASGRAARTAFIASVMLGTSTLVGAVFMMLMRHGVAIGLPISTGVTIYVAASDIVPEVNHEKGWLMPALLFVGVALLFMLDWMFHVSV